MDNSRRISTAEDTNCTSTSMYLSFDAESSISSLAYKTLETSTASELNADITNMNEQSQNMNSTLEANNSIKVHYADSNERTVKFLETVGSRGPLRTLQKNFMNDKVLCSTPTKKEQLLLSTEIEEISAANVDIDVKLEFPDLEKQQEKPMNPPITIVEDNKENTHPKLDDFSTVSVSSSMEIETSIIERKANIEESQLLNEKESIECLEVIENKQVIPKTNIQQVPKGVDVNEHVNSELREPPNSIKSVCLPDSKMNRPHHKLSNTTMRVSLLAPNTRLKCVRDETEEMPKLLKKMLKISGTRENKQSTASNSVQQKSTINLKQSVKLSTNAQAEKRPFNYTQRMPAMAKTTLNSPNRKIPRRSVLPQLRKSMLPAVRQTAQSAVPAAAATIAVTSNSNNVVKQQIQSKIPSTRKSLYAKPKSVTDSKNPPTTAAKCTNNESVKTCFVCFVCRKKFSLKSLLNAHMRSHEDDTPARIRPPSVCKSNFSTANNVLSNDESQCKYCDKKFALVRALHIHLMENCVKIPPKEKRKLQFTELNHVEKAQLPAVFHASGPETSNSNPHAATLLSSNSSMKSDKRSMSSYSLSDSNGKRSPIRSEKKDITELANELVAAVDGVLNKMAPPSLPKARNASSNMPHSGVFRTPNKAVPCHLCKKTFKSVFDYTNHSMIMHKTIVYSPPTNQGREKNPAPTQNTDE